MIRVAIVEDDKELRAFLEDVVGGSEEFILQDSFSTAEDFRKKFHPGTDLDAVLMDINLPGMSGIECIEQLKPRNRKVQYLVYTVFEDSSNLFNALCAGATGYILKSASEEEIRKAIKDIHEGGSPMSPQIARLVVSAFPSKKSNKTLVDSLTHRERELLDLLAAGFRYKEIADKLSLSTETVRSYIRDIYSKLHVHSRTDAVNKLYNS
jgi:DNA-binding NarL/FixJ family response regulator